MSVCIRRMKKEDVEPVFNLEKLIFGDPWTLRSFLTEVETKDNSYPCVLIKDNLLAGYAVVWYYNGEIHIGNFAVHPDYRRMGLGNKLLKHILEKFKNYDIAYLEVRRSNVAAINLYKKFAFNELYVRDQYYTDNEDAIVMWKKLKH